MPLPTVRRYSDEGDLLSLARFVPASAPTANLTESASTPEPMEVHDDLESFACESNSTEQTHEHNPQSPEATVKKLPTIKMETSLAKSLVWI